MSLSERKEATLPNNPTPINGMGWPSRTAPKVYVSAHVGAGRVKFFPGAEITNGLKVWLIECLID